MGWLDSLKDGDEYKKEVAEAVKEGKMTNPKERGKRQRTIRLLSCVFLVVLFGISLMRLIVAASLATYTNINVSLQGLRELVCCMWSAAFFWYLLLLGHSKRSYHEEKVRLRHNVGNMNKGVDYEIDRAVVGAMPYFMLKTSVRAIVVGGFLFMLPMTVIADPLSVVMMSDGTVGIQKFQTEAGDAVYFYKPPIDMHNLFCASVVIHVGCMVTGLNLMICGP
ncbi:hypothetical protein H4R18_003914 [Coemansia javaensis]|uniref:Uncharacterized protein n=1 Tax=Coemansia javaensis TaxID=2761396 RepID=A0A9W8H782_9FUNG|nr:hypothetical protein H4R18_003914 [Coemansia javaensis]